MKTKLENNSDKYYVEIPPPIAGLYSLKDGKIFDIKANDNGRVLFINLSAPLDE